MAEINYRKLGKQEINLLHQIDRTETIERVWIMEDGEMVLKDVHWEVPEWSRENKDERIADLEKVFDQGATFYGAFDGDKLAGMAVLDHNFLAGSRKRLNLEGLWVSSGYRGLGVGKHLFDLAAELAKEMEAAAMYVSATSSENTVGFYQNRGCVPANPIDQCLFELEPEDIHLELNLTETG